MIEFDVTIASVFIALISVIVAVASFIVGRKDKGVDNMKDMRESLLKANMKLDQVCATTNETRTDIKSMDLKISEVEKKMLVLKTEVSTLRKDVDNLKTRVEDIEV